MKNMKNVQRKNGQRKVQTDRRSSQERRAQGEGRKFDRGTSNRHKGERRAQALRKDSRQEIKREEIRKKTPNNSLKYKKSL